MQSGQATIKDFEGVWEGPWINMMRSPPVGVRGTIDIQADGSCFYTHTGSKDRGISPSSKNPRRKGVLKDGVFSFEGLEKDKKISFEIMDKGCQDEDPARPGHAKDVPGPCLHGRDSKHLNVHGYLFRKNR